MSHFGSLMHQKMVGVVHSSIQSIQREERSSQTFSPERLFIRKQAFGNILIPFRTFQSKCKNCCLTGRLIPKEIESENTKPSQEDEYTHKSMKRFQMVDDEDAFSSMSVGLPNKRNYSILLSYK